MESIFTSELLAAVHGPADLPGPLAVLCLSPEWGPVEQQTLALAYSLRQSGRPVTLVVAPGAPLHRQAQALELTCQPLRARWKSLNVPAAAALARWLRREKVAVLLTTLADDLGLASLVRKWRGEALRLVHRQLEQLPAPSAWHDWWGRQQADAVDAWVAPLPGQARQVQARTRLDPRRLWVVPPPLRPHPAADGHGTRAEARHLLDLPATAPLIGVMDCGDDGPAFAVEALYRLLQEHEPAAEMVVIGGPATPQVAQRWAQVRQLAQRLRLSHRLHLRPLHNSASPTLFYQALDVLLLPAAPNASGLSLLEAMRSGCPLVSVQAADAPDVLEAGRTAHLFALHDVAAAAHALALALGNPPASRQMAARAAALVAQQCRPAQQCRQLETIIQYIGRHEPAA